MPVDIETELDLARNMFGNLDAKLKARLRRVVEKPNRRTWDGAYSIILYGHTTLWQAVCELDPSFIGIGKVTDQHGRVVRPWVKVPDQELLVRAIRFATH
jgi:hypothetical protein